MSSKWNDALQVLKGWVCVPMPNKWHIKSSTKNHKINNVSPKTSNVGLDTICSIFEMYTTNSFISISVINYIFNIWSNALLLPKDYWKWTISHNSPMNNWDILNLKPEAPSGLGTADVINGMLCGGTETCGCKWKRTCEFRNWSLGDQSIL